MASPASPGESSAEASEPPSGPVNRIAGSNDDPNRRAQASTVSRWPFFNRIEKRSVAAASRVPSTAAARETTRSSPTRDSSRPGRASSNTSRTLESPASATTRIAARPTLVAGTVTSKVAWPAPSPEPTTRLTVAGMLVQSERAVSSAAPLTVKRVTVPGTRPPGEMS